MLRVALVVGVAAVGLLAPAQATAAGGLRFLGCVTGKLPVGRMPRLPHPGGCTPTRTAVLDAEGSGLDHLKSVAASPDGRSLYAIDQLKELGELKAQGILTDEEFAAQKAKLLAS